MMSIRTPASFNSKIRGKKINISEYNKNLISDALSLIWIKTDHKIETCYFERNNVRVSYKKNEGYGYFDLHESFEEISTDFMSLQQKNVELDDMKLKLNNVINELEDYKNKYESILNQNINLQNELQKFTSLQKNSINDITTAGTVDYSNDIIDELTKEVLASVSVKDFCNDLDKWIIKNNNSFGKYDATITITGKVDTVVSSDTTKSSVRIIDYHDDINKRIMKINNFDESSVSSLAVTTSSSSSSSSTSSSSTSSTSSMTMEIKPPEKILTKEKEAHKITVSKCKQTNIKFKDANKKNCKNDKNDDIEKSNKNKSKAQKRKINHIETSDDNNNNKLDPLQFLLLKKGRKLNKILLRPPINDDDALIISNQSESKIINIINELLVEPIKIIDEDSAEARIYQWKNQELQYEKFRVALESYNLLHLMSLIQIYDDLLKVGEEIKNNPEKNIKNVKIWVFDFVRNKLNIKSKLEQRNRLGCNRLLQLFNEGITSDQIVKAGFHKCDFFVKQQDYDIFLSQIPSSLNLSNDYLSDSTETSNINKPQLIHNNDELQINNNNNNQNTTKNEARQNTSNKKQKIMKS
ncbi:hypothetical protein RhiirC2_854588 [Rhizophagus irregularis]|uniref:Uncharacterized protein n=1 Tax=Rhizophagus irregularis TaxID=588596 RepID=A0A2N1MQZ5_9GLOM|nr:hypothetical protein RhiirC2_854588 [Rhizophagus irregularis]